jgi:hypothetical protein
MSFSYKALFYGFNPKVFNEKVATFSHNNAVYAISSTNGKQAEEAPDKGTHDVCDTIHTMYKFMRD